MTLGPLFDSAASEAEKRSGMTRAVWLRRLRLDEAREIAREIARTQDTVSADDVAKYFWERYSTDLWEYLGNAAGAIFRGKEWEWYGYARSVRVRSHRNLIRRWRLR